MVGLLGFLNTSFPAIGNANNVHSSVPGHENQEEKVIIEKKKKKRKASLSLFFLLLLFSVGVVMGGHLIERNLLGWQDLIPVISEFCPAAVQFVPHYFY